MGIRSLILLLLIVVVIFGTSKLRNVGSDLGSAVRGFRNALREGDGARTAPRDSARIVADQPGEDLPDAEFPESAGKSADRQAKT